MNQIQYSTIKYAKIRHNTNNADTIKILCTLSQYRSQRCRVMPSIGQLQYNTSSAVFYEIVTTLSGVGYASVNEHKQLQTCCNYLIS